MFKTEKWLFFEKDGETGLYHLLHFKLAYYLFKFDKKTVVIEYETVM